MRGSTPHSVDPAPLSRAELRELDRRAIEQLGIPGVVLMENAGRGAAEWIVELAAERALRRVAIVCGRGNNGGDGYVVARHLHNAGLEVEIFSSCPGSDLGGDAAAMRSIVEQMGLPIQDATIADLERLAMDRSPSREILVDALLGTGFQGELRADALAWIDSMNARQATLTVALDLPSGLDCDTGRPSPKAVRAHVTATFAAPKLGFSAPEAAEFIGRVVVFGIGAPRFHSGSWTR